MRIRYYKNEFIFKERGKKLSSQVGYSQLLCRHDGSKPTAIFKNDSEKQCIINDDDFIIDVKIYKGKHMIVINTLEFDSIKNIDGRYEIELYPQIITNNLNQIPDYLKSATMCALKRANIFNCSESVFIQ